MEAWIVSVCLFGACATPTGPDELMPPVSTAVAPTADDWSGICSAPNRFERTRELLARTPGEASDDDRALGELLARCGHGETRALLAELVRFQTVAAIAEPADNDAFTDMAAHLSDLADRRGLEMRVVGEHDAWEMILPGQDRDVRQLVFLTHADVAPANAPPAFIEPSSVPDGWTVPAFEITERDGRLYGRGAEDDKGPIAAVITVLSMMREAEVVPRGDVVLVMGTAEEYSWDGMRRYAELAPPAAHTLCIDAMFPVVFAQSGFVAWGLTLPTGTPEASGLQPVVREMSGGLFPTQIPDHATLVLEPRGQSVSELADTVRAVAMAETEARGEGHGFEVEELIDAVRLTTRGTSAHSSIAEQGHNALWLLAAIAQPLDLAEGGARTMLRVLADVFDGDHHGVRLGIHYEDVLMGPLLVAPTVLRMEEGAVTLQINMRQPQGRTTEQLEAALEQAVQRLRETHDASLSATEAPFFLEPHVADLDGPLVQRLLEIYRDETGSDDAAPIAIRGSSYARLFEGAISFGPSFPGERYAGHGADEHIGVDALARVDRMYLAAALSLAR